MKNQFRLIRFVFVALLLVGMFPTETYAGPKKAKKADKMTVSSLVVNQNDEPLSGAVVYFNGGKDILNTDAEGKFSISVVVNSKVLIEAKGCESYIWDLSKNPNAEKLELNQLPLFASEEDELILPMYQSVSKRYAVGAITKMNVDNIAKYANSKLSNALQGQGMGMSVMANAGSLNSNTSSILVRGLSRSGGGGGPIVIVDGIERPFNDVMAEEIETIEVLKDATAKIIYGPSAANGVILIQTKRGKAHKRSIKASVETGMGQVTRMPQFLDSYAYATLYNEARANDGLVPMYSAKQLNGYKNSTGENDQEFPNADYHDYFLNSHTNFTRVTTEFIGGDDNARYAVNLGYVGGKGLQSEGVTPTNDRFNVRANLNANISRTVEAFLDLSAIINTNNYAGISENDLFGRMSNHRPNEYPFIVDENTVASTERGIPGYGASYAYNGNVLADLVHGGNMESQSVNQQMNMGLNFDFNSLLEGLSGKAFITFDNNFYGQEQVSSVAATYASQYIADGQGLDSLSFQKVRMEDYSIDHKLADNSMHQTLGITGLLNYDKTIGDGEFSSALGYYYFKRERSNVYQIKNMNSYLHTNYVYDKKYVAEFDLSLMGCSQFGTENLFLSPAVGMAWILSEESFMDQLANLDFLKMKTSWGLLGYSGSIPFNLYDNRWYMDNKVTFGERGKGDVAVRNRFESYGNPDLEWETSSEFNIGFEGAMFDKRLSFETNYFNETRDNIINNLTAFYSSIYANELPMDNLGKINNQGVEAELYWSDKAGDFSYTIGGNVLYSKNKVIEANAIDFAESRTTIGKPTDIIMGYESLGLFGRDVAIAGAPDQMLGEYGVGDIAYRNINATDNEINDLDRTDIGNEYPRTSMGLSLDLHYKGFGLYALGTAFLGFDRELTNTYYRNSGEGKYSEKANDRYHPTANPNGSQPLLTTASTKNNYAMSDFWLEDGDFFRLKNVEVSYTFNFSKTATRVNKLKVYARGNNLLTISKIKDLDPEVIDAGVNSYPVLRTITAGVSMSF